MATKSTYKRSKISPESGFSDDLRSIIETAFYCNNVTLIPSLGEAYQRTLESPGAIVTDMPVHRPEEVGLPEDAKIIVSNDGAVHSRCAAARRIIGDSDVDREGLTEILKEAAYGLGRQKCITASSVIGLDKDFTVKARLLLPEGQEALLYNWLLNFQEFSEEMDSFYKESKKLEEGDILVIADPAWTHPDYPYGLTLFDPAYNCAAILGMRYFGEYKKGTLTLAWNIASRNGYLSCHGGVKRYNLQGGDPVVVGVFGLSGSGKSTLVHATHDDAYDITILHDDAFIIESTTGKSIALEPSYFDKTADYPLESEDNKYLLSVQNCGVTMDSDGKKVVVCEDIRNKNGRAIKSKLWSKNRVDSIEEPIDRVIWLMKDPMLPPVMKLTDPTLAATMGALLATKRTSAERLAKGVDYESLVIEPYANPFRIYSLEDDYMKFKTIFERGVDCYVLNTGHFMNKKVTKEMTLSLLEMIVKKEGTYRDWPLMKGAQIMDIEGFTPDDDDELYVEGLLKSITGRSAHIRIYHHSETDSREQLPDEVLLMIKTLQRKLKERKQGNQYMRTCQSGAMYL